jgi:hypothetical protein
LGKMCRMNIADAIRAYDELARVADDARDMIAACAVGEVLRDNLHYAADLLGHVEGGLGDPSGVDTASSRAHDAERLPRV